MRMSWRRWAAEFAWSRNMTTMRLRVDFPLGEVVLRGRHVAIEDTAAGEGGQPHVGPGDVGAAADISAAVCPAAAKCILFCMMAKKVWVCCSPST